LWRSLEKGATQKQDELIRTQLDSPAAESAKALGKALIYDVQQGFELLKSSWTRAKT
jgi:hypothetical protein